MTGTPLLGSASPSRKAVGYMYIEGPSPSDRLVAPALAPPELGV